MTPQTIPDVLKTNALWCVWKRHEEKGKIPFSPITGFPVKSNQANTFSDFNAAIGAYQKGEYDGLGIGVFRGFSAIDIDHCINDGQLSEMAQDIIECMGSYTEVSPSGTGIRIIFTITDFNYDTDSYYIHNHKIGLEIYVSGVTNKFVTITGNVLNDNAVVDGSSTLPAILDKYMRRPIKEHTPSLSSLVSQSNADYLEIGLKKDSKLIAYWKGDRPLESESENDMGFMSKLLYWTNGDVDAAIRAFLSSPYVAQKDDAHKKKLERKDYLPVMINAITLNSTAAADSAQWKTEKHNAERQVKKPPAVMSAQALQKAELPPVRYLVADILPEGTSLLSAASKIGKSWFVLDMGMKIAAGSPFMDKQTTQVGVLYFALEDSWSRLQKRMNRLLGGNTAPEQFYFVTEAASIDDGFFDAVGNYVKEHPDIKLLIIDTLQKIRGQALPRESAYQQDYREMGRVKKYADSHGISVFFVHHNRKMKDDSDPFNMVSGTNGIMGAADTTLVITKKARTDKDAVLHITGRDVQQCELSISFNKDSCRWMPLGETRLLEEAKEKTTYYSNPIVRAIKALLKSSTDGKWDGTASKLMREGELLIHSPLAHSSQAVGNQLESLESLLLKYDGISYTKSPNGNAGAIHHFYLCKDDSPDVEF